ncbi:MAG: hypothetical protein WBN20_12850 [Eudoraea sp.]|uniref:hypothetical protein n=1 Tax=Eudoraea sp. TaxID=1979955 RepID=UPI003C759DCE
MLNVFEAGALEIRDKHSFDLPEIKSKKDWNQLFNEIWTNAEKFVKHVENMTSDQLENIFVHEKYGTFLP